MKLNPKYKQTRSNLIMMKDLPSLSEVYVILIQEQVHLDIGKNEEDLLQESSMAHRVEKRKHYDSRNKNYGNKKQASFCDHCKMQGHTLENCWKILPKIGSPPIQQNKDFVP